MRVGVGTHTQTNRRTRHTLTRAAINCCGAVAATPRYAASASLHSLFKLEAESTEEVYGGVSKMRLGVETMLAVLEGDGRHADSLRYAVGLLQIEKKFRRSGKLQQQVGQGLKNISALGDELEQHEREDLQAHEISELYTETISTLSPRIVVNGNPQYL